MMLSTSPLRSLCSLRSGFAAFLSALFVAMPLAATQAGNGPRLSSDRIDSMVEERLKQESLAPAGPATDAEFLRRASLDVRGTIPSVEEAIAFQTDKSPNKRAAIIDKFLSDPLRGQEWANYWDKLLVGSLNLNQNNPLAAVRQKAPWKSWVAEEFNANKPYDEFAREIVTAEGPADTVPQTLPIVRWQSSIPDVTGAMTRVFLGKQIQCAQCHNHPYEESLTQQKFWQMAAFFARAKADRMQGVSGPPRGFQVLERATGELEIPDSKPSVLVQPIWIDGTAGTSGRTANRRMEYANFLTEHERKQFARNFVNRLWAHYLGRGILDPVDDWLTTGVSPSHPELLEALTDEFIESKFDVRAMEKMILNSRTYQRSSAANSDLVRRPELFGAAAMRPLSPDQLFSSIDRAATLLGRAKESSGRFSDALYQRYLNRFTFMFGNDEMEENTAFDANMLQALFLFNDTTLNNALGRSEGSTLARVSQTSNEPREQVDYLFLATVGRRADKEELADLSDQLGKAPRGKERDAMLQDMLWALINSAEFRTNH